MNFEQAMAFGKKLGSGDHSFYDMALLRSFMDIFTIKEVDKLMVIFRATPETYPSRTLDVSPDLLEHLIDSLP